MYRFAAALALCLVATPALAADPVEGDWQVGGHVLVHISPCVAAPNELCGLIIAAPNGPDGHPDRDSNNPDPKLRSRPIVGVALIRGFRRAEAGRWVGGKIYDPDSGKTYASTLQIAPTGALRVEGCVLVFCQRQVWKPTP
jgi:uncharacterized protein (DUF2147 family)